MTSEISEAAPAWLRSKRFDLSFVAAPTALALASGAAVVAQPSLFIPILTLDIWLLGFHHVISTFTRLCADESSVREHRRLLTTLPAAVLVGVLAIGFGVGFWALTTIYLYWQWFHYTRQSWGIARVYERKMSEPLPEDPRLFAAAFYLLPLWGILHRSQQDPDEFLRLDVETIVVPSWLVTSVGAAAILAMLAVGVIRIAAWRNGRLPMMHTLFLVTHFAIFGVGYLAISDIDHGWLVLNVWHNAQYVAFVWYFNNRQAAQLNETAVAPTLVQRMSASHRVVGYFALSIAASTVIYLTLQLTLALVVAPIVIYQTINFHHYIVDSRIWKVRKKPLQTTLGIGS